MTIRAQTFVILVYDPSLSGCRESEIIYNASIYNGLVFWGIF